MSKKIGFVIDETKLNKLMKETGVDSYKELMNNALTLLEYKMNVEKQGFEFGAYDPSSDNFKGVEILKKQLL